MGTMETGNAWRMNIWHDTVGHARMSCNIEPGYQKLDIEALIATETHCRPWHTLFPGPCPQPSSRAGL